jgi:predicted RNA methylase
VRVGDFDVTTGKLMVSLKKGAPMTSVKLTRPVRSSLKRYRAALGGQVGVMDPLFGAVKKGNFDLKTAACSAELRRVIAKRAKAAKLSTKRIYVK